MVLASLKARVSLAVLFTGTLWCGLAAAAEQPDDDALRLRNHVVAHYTHANAIHLEATIVAVTRGELEQITHTSYLSAWVATGGRFRYEGRNFTGSGLIVSDGVNEWHLARSWSLYTKQPAGSYFHGRIVYEYDNWAMLEAKQLIGNITGLDAQVKELKTLAPQKLHYQGRNVRCVVVQYKSLASRPVEHTLWIDPISLTVIKEESRSSNPYLFRGEPVPHGPVSESIVTTTYTTTEIDRLSAANTFAFTPPPGATEVASLPSTFDGQRALPVNSKHAAEYIGKPLPALTLNDSTGTKVPLSSFTGHPLLISVWATWCGPCVQELPALDRIRSSLVSTDLQMIALDQDEAATTAAALLDRRGYAWKNFHADISTAQQLGVDGLPTIILADASGKVVYYGLGGDMQALKTAIRGLGHSYESALSN